MNNVLIFYNGITANKMPLDLYYYPGSAPCRGVLLTAKALGIDLNLKVVDFMKGDNLEPPFIKINPQHTIPTLIDDGFRLWESRAIMAYLTDQYGKNDSLYPKDPKKRALINQRLYFDMSLYDKFVDCYYPVIFAGVHYDPEKVDKAKEAFKFFETFLEKCDFAAGHQLTIADLSLLATVTTFEAVKFDMIPYKRASAWVARVKVAAPGYEQANGKGLDQYKRMVAKLTRK